MRTLIPKIKIEQTLEQNKHPERKGMINVYSCTNCSSQFKFVYLDNGVTPVTMRCPNCNKETAESAMGKVTQPDSIWYRPRDLNEIKQIRDAAYEHDKELYKKTCKEQNISEKRLKEIILNNYIKHYNQGGLFSKVRI